MKPKLLRRWRRQRQFKRALLATRHYELIWVMDATISCFYPTKNQVAHVVRKFIANKLTIEEAVKMGYCFATPSKMSNFYYRGEYMVNLHAFMKNLCGVDVSKNMRYSDVMRLKATTSIKVIRQAIREGIPNRCNRDTNFVTYYQELYD